MSARNSGGIHPCFRNAPGGTNLNQRRGRFKFSRQLKNFPPELWSVGSHRRFINMADDTGEMSAAGNIITINFALVTRRGRRGSRCD